MNKKHSEKIPIDRKEKNLKKGEVKEIAKHSHHT